MDLSQFDSTKKSSAGVAMTLRSPIDGKDLIDEGTKQPLTITLIGQDSAEFRAMQHRLSSKRLNAAVKKKLRLDADELDADTLSMLAKSTKAWQGIVVEGKALDCNESTARSLYERMPWIREQVEEFISDRSNFLGN